MNRDRTISQGGVDLIKSFVTLRLQAYRDSVGILAIGYGSTRGVREGDQISHEEADARLFEDLGAAEACVRSSLNMVRLTQHQFDALVSFVFDLGCRAFRNMPMCRMLERGDFESAAKEFQHYNRAGVDYPRGLLRRREAEAAWFRMPD